MRSLRQLPAYVEAEIYLLEILVEERRKAEDVSVQKQKANQTDVVLTGFVIEKSSFRYQRRQHRRIDLVIEHRQITPLSAEKRRPHPTSFLRRPRDVRRSMVLRRPKRVRKSNRTPRPISLPAVALPGTR